MKIYILGICGTFMAGIALLAREKGYLVSGSDANVYPPMSTQLEEAGITLYEGYSADNLDLEADIFIVGNAISRGNEQIETILDKNLNYISAPQWLYENVLKDKWVLAVAGTHGKTTTSSMLAWILQDNDLNPGFLIGGIPSNFTQSARLGDAPFFVIEADEYDTAFFDKRSKFVHYHPRTAVLNNLEFDHADIFENLDAIKKQFHHLVRIIPQTGLIIHNKDINNLDDVLAKGCWSETISFGSNDQANFEISDGHIIDHHEKLIYKLSLQQSGTYNQLNALSAILAARHAGVPIVHGIRSMATFKGVKRRQELLATINGIQIIDDFAHHPTAIQMTLAGLKKESDHRVIVVLELRSNTMSSGIHDKTLPFAFDDADEVYIFDNGHINADFSADKFHVLAQTQAIINELSNTSRSGDRIIIMSNGGFEGIHQRLIKALNNKYE